LTDEKIYDLQEITNLGSVVFGQFSSIYPWVKYS